MTSQQEQMTLQQKLRDVLGNGPAATLMSMLPSSDELATKTDLIESGAVLRTEMAGLRTELKTEMADVGTELRTGMAELRVEMAGVRSEVASLRQEMELKYATRDDLFAIIDGFNDTMAGYVRTFIVVQGATVVGMSAILFGLLQLT